MTVTPMMIKEISCIRDIGWCLVLSQGRSGGILMLWDKIRVEVDDRVISVYSLSVIGQIKGDLRCWMISGVYGSTNSSLLPNFLMELETVRSQRSLPWCIGSDFNEVLFTEERHGGRRRSQGMDLLGSFVDRLGLMDMSIMGPPYTWSNFQVNPTMSKLDRFLISSEWDE